jgi:hypothetical protein
MGETKHLTLIRDTQDEWATLGKLSIDGQHLCHTLERPWLNNKPRVSCIPHGTYHGAIQPSPRFKRDLPELLDVPGRDQILIHVGNTVDDSAGCILVGLERAEHESRIMQSKAALSLLMANLEGCDGFTLTVSGKEG